MKAKIKFNGLTFIANQYAVDSLVAFLGGATLVNENYKKGGKYEYTQREFEEYQGITVEFANDYPILESAETPAKESSDVGF